MNNYAKAIQVLLEAKIDWKVLVYEIAKTNPTAVASAADRINRNTQGEWQNPCRELVASGKKIDAIKLCRSATGMGLKEAKDAVEAL